MTASGIAAAINELGAGETARADLEEREQLEIFAEIEAGEAELTTAPRAWSGKGRKPGARNRVTRDVINYIQRHGRDPLIALQSMVKMTPAELRSYWGIDGHEAAEFWRKCVSDLAAYMHSKQPQAVVMETGKGFAPIFLNFGEMTFAANDGAAAPDRQKEITAQYQQVNPDAQEQVAWPQGRTDIASV